MPNLVSSLGGAGAAYRPPLSARARMNWKQFGMILMSTGWIIQ
jgi:hypothetical protein